MIPVQYVGGKYRSASAISAEILRRRDRRPAYIEPFLGGAAVATKMAPWFDDVRLSDTSPDLILMWQALQAGWTPPDHVSQQEYDALKTANSSALRGFVGYGCSFGGKWFGGYARSRNGAAPNYNYAAGAVRSVLKTASAIKHANICQQDYRTVHVAPWAVVYADPPYIGTQGYGSDFDTEEFWTVADRWADTGALVLVSEHVAPPGWDLVWSKGLPNYLNGTEQVSGARTECLFIRKDQKEIRA